MGYTKVDISSLMHNRTIFPQKKVAATALRQANNGLGQAVQLLQEQPDLIQVGCIGIFFTGRQYLLKSRPDNLKILRRELQVSFSLPSLKFNTFFFTQLAAEERTSGGDEDDNMQVGFDVLAVFTPLPT